MSTPVQNFLIFLYGKGHYIRHGSSGQTDGRTDRRADVSQSYMGPSIDGTYKTNQLQQNDTLTRSSKDTSFPQALYSHDIHLTNNSG